MAAVFKTNQAIWIGIYVAVLLWSGIGPRDYTTWILEVFPAVLGASVLWYTRNTFPLTRMVYVLILFHCIILMVGGHYTYAEVPLFDWLKDEFDLARNNYDKVGHFVQGFVPAMIAREIVVRHHVFNYVGWRNFFIICFCLGLSAFYEMIEWVVALASAEAADAFLGTQGYVWDTQSDMAYALVGAVIALTFLGGIHDRRMNANDFVAPKTR